MNEEEVLKAAWASVRETRTQLLRKTDFTQLPDSPLTEAQRAEVATYRQQLRDLTELSQSPFEVVWPTSPSFL